MAFPVQIRELRLEREMQGGGGNRPGPFDGFPDPFANFGFGMMGGGRGGVGGGGAGFGSQGGMRSLFDVFDNDPFFSDPFFTRPFGGSFGSFLGSRGGLGHPFFGLPQPPFEPRQAVYLDNQPHNPQGVCDPFFILQGFLVSSVVLGGAAGFLVYVKRNLPRLLRSSTSF